MLPATGLDEFRAIPPMRTSMPLHPFLVPLPTTRRTAPFVQRMVLNVDVIVREKEVRLILAVLRRLGPLRVRAFIAELHAVLREVVRYLELLEALDPSAATPRRWASGSGTAPGRRL